VELVFFRAQGRADLGQIIGEGRVLPCTREKTGIFDSLVLNPFGIQNAQSQQTLNCALSVDLL
jgi:hypothetical protein